MRKNQKGFGLLETLIGGGLLAMVALGLGTMMTSTRTSSVLSSATLERVGLDTRMASISGQYETLYRIAATNAAVRDCVAPLDATRKCQNNNNGTSNYEVYLYEPTSTASTTFTAVSGPAGAEILYTRHGEKCQGITGAANVSPRCPLMVRSFIRTLCDPSDNPANTCNKALAVTLFYEIKRAPFTGPGSVPISDQAPAFRDVANFVRVGNDLVGGDVFSPPVPAQLCNTPNALLKGLANNKGGAKCSFPLVDSGQAPQNVALTGIDAYGAAKKEPFVLENRASCNGNQILKGFSSDGVANCAAAPQRAYLCSPLNGCH